MKPDGKDGMEGTGALGRLRGAVEALRWGTPPRSMGKPQTKLRDGPIPDYRCAICKGPVEETQLLYRCQPEAVTWDKNERRLLERLS